MCSRWASTVLTLMNSSSADVARAHAAADAPEDLELAVAQPLGGVGGPGGPAAAAAAARRGAAASFAATVRLTYTSPRRMLRIPAITLVAASAFIT